jgi:hypothetical protein
MLDQPDPLMDGPGGIPIPRFLFYQFGEAEGIRNLRTTTSTITWPATIDPTDDLFGLADAGVIDLAVTAMPEHWLVIRREARCSS